MLPRNLIFVVLGVLAMARCTEQPGSNVDAEPALAILGGAIMATQNDSLLASHTSKSNSHLQRILNILDPMPEAFAAACPILTTASCNAEVMTIFYDNCYNSTLSRPGYWRSYLRFTFPAPADCTTMLGTGFNAAGAAFMAGKTVTRTYGLGQSGDQLNIKLGATGYEAVFMYSDYPSGWVDDRTGGADITFVTAAQRSINIQGIQGKGIAYVNAPVTDATSFDLTTLDTDVEQSQTIKMMWDHTVNTVKTGDSLFQLGPTITQGAGGVIEFGGMTSNTTASFDGDIIVNTDTVDRGAALRIQHNMSESLAVLVVTEPLVYSDNTCCYPMSGSVHVQYDRNFMSPTLEEQITFTGESCGAIKYTTSVVTDDDRTLQHCF